MFVHIINITDDFVTCPTPFIRCSNLLPHVTCLTCLPLTKKVADVDVEDHHGDKNNKIFMDSKHQYLVEYK